MKYRIIGEFRDSGHEALVLIDALTPELAAQAAHGKGILVKKVDPVGNNSSITRPTTRESDEPEMAATAVTHPVEVRRSKSATMANHAPNWGPGQASQTAPTPTALPLKLSPIGIIILGFLFTKFVIDPVFLWSQERQELHDYGQQVMEQFQGLYPAVIADWALDVQRIRTFDNGNKQGTLKIELLLANGETFKFSMVCLWEKSSERWYSQEEIALTLQEVLETRRATWDR